MIDDRGVRLHFFSVSSLSVCAKKSRFDRSEAKVLLSDLSFDLDQGEMIFVIGASGSGKSTLLKAISFFHTNDLIQTGQISLLGEQLQGLNQKVFLLQQDPILFPHLPVIEQFRLIGLAARHHHGDRLSDQGGLMLAQRIEDLSCRFQIDHLMQSYPHMLSGGEAQRVALVRALLMSPSVLLLDEPFAHLDLYLRKRLKRMVWQDLKQRQLGGLWVTHDWQEVKAEKCRVIWMENGKGVLFKGWDEMCAWGGSVLLGEMLSEME